jgi:hypothetical protein
MRSGVAILTMNALSTKLDGIAPFISPKLSESLPHALTQSLYSARVVRHTAADVRRGRPERQHPRHALHNGPYRKLRALPRLSLLALEERSW